MQQQKWQGSRTISYGNYSIQLRFTSPPLLLHTPLKKLKKTLKITSEKRKLYKENRFLN